MPRRSHVPAGVHPYMSTHSYELIAEAINEIESTKAHQYVADHFANFFHRKSRSFNAEAWYDRTGGRVKDPQRQTNLLT